MSTKQPTPPLWQRAIGVFIGTAVGGVIYGIFLQALLIQSLLFDRKPLDPANWRQGLSAKAWICGLFLFLTLIAVPFRFTVRSAGATVLTDLSEGGVVWFLVATIFLIQLATIRYAWMRPELATIEKAGQVFTHGRIKIHFSLKAWKNWIQLVILVMEFLQLFSMALDGGKALEVAGVRLFPSQLLDGAQQLKTAVWQFGMTPPTVNGEAVNYDAGFGLLCGFSGLYILLCGIFIALDLTVESPLAPLLFTLLAGGFYGSITSGLLLMILYSQSASHVIVCLLMLAYYSSTAVFVSIYRSDVKKSPVGEIQLMPAFTAVERVSKGILSAVSVATLHSTTTVRASISLTFCLIYAAFLLRMRPYSVVGLTWIRFGFVLIAAWTSLVVLGAASRSDTELGPLFETLLLLGWILIPLGIGIVWIVSARITMHRSTPITALVTLSPLETEIHTAGDSNARGSK